MKYESKPYWFGLGFIQLKLDDRERMHFWMPEVPRLEREEIHDHRYTFFSQIVAGTLKHETYAVQPDLNGDYELFETNCAPGNEGSVGHTIPCFVTPLGAYDLTAGSSYVFNHQSFHTTEQTSFAITHLQREEKVKQAARVVKKRGANSVCPFRDSDALSEIDCWELIESGLYRASMLQLQSSFIIPCQGCGKPSGSFGNPIENTIYKCITCALDL